MASILQRAWHRREKPCGMSLGTLTQPTSNKARREQAVIYKLPPAPCLPAQTAIGNNGPSQYRSYLHCVWKNETTRGMPVVSTHTHTCPVAVTEWHQGPLLGIS